MLRTTVGIFIVFVFFLSTPVSAKVYIDIDSPAFQRFPVAIPDFKSFGGADTLNLSSRFSEDLTAVLKLTGFFRIIEKGAFLEDEATAGITADSIEFSEWSAIRAEYLVKGGFQQSGDDISAEFRLFDVVNGSLITGKKYWGTVAELKVMIVKFANEILFALTGEKGVFDTRIAFVGKTGKKSEIYIINFDGVGLERVSNSGSLTLLPHWSIDGGQISFTSYARGNPDLYIMDLQTRKKKRVSSYRGLNLSGPWSPNGKKVLVTLSKDGNEEIYVINFDTKKLRRLTYDPAIDVSPTWSPDGEKIAFVSNRSGSPQIFVMNSNGEKVRRITFEGKYNTSPSWSPKGNKIVYEGTSNGVFQLFAVNEDGNDFMQLTFETGGCEYPTWSPDGRYLAFSSKKNGRMRLCIINANGLNLRVLHDGKDFEALYPSWSPRLNLY